MKTFTLLLTLVTSAFFLLLREPALALVNASTDTESQETFLYMNGQFYQVHGSVTTLILSGGESRIRKNSIVMVAAVVKDSDKLEVKIGKDSPDTKLALSSLGPTDMTKVLEQPQFAAEPYALTPTAGTRAKIARALALQITSGDIMVQSRVGGAMQRIWGASLPAKRHDLKAAGGEKLLYATFLVTESTLHLSMAAAPANADPVTATWSFDLSRPSGLLLGLSGGAIYSFDSALNYQTVPAFVNGVRLQINGQDASKIVTTKGGTQITNSLTGLLYYVFAEDQDPFGKFFRETFRDARGALQLGFGSSGADQHFYIGPALLLDREGNLAFSLGLTYRNAPILVDQRVGDFVTNTTLNTVNRWQPGFYFGLSYGITAQVKTAGSGSGGN